MEILILTGMSGAGKSVAREILEDIGFFCVDNLPTQMIKKFVEISNGTLERVAIVMDVRTFKISKTFEELKSDPKKIQGSVSLLFLNASDDVLIKRFQEQRRIHPLIGGEIATTQQAIQQERIILENYRQRADYTIDTSSLLPSQLKNQIRQIFLSGRQGIIVNCVSFGYKNGLPSDADLVFDVRCLPNPFYIPELRGLTGMNQEVQDYVMSFQESQDLMKKLEELVSLLLPLYQKEGKSQVTLAFGCTGGQHRSVTFAERMHKFVMELGFFGVASHRDAGKERR